LVFGPQAGWIFPTTVARLALPVLQPRQWDPRLAHHARLDHFLPQVKPVLPAVLELMVAALVLANALRASPAHSAIRRVPPSAPLVRPVLTRNWVKASAPHAVPVPMPINPVPAHACHALLVITLWLARPRARSAHLAHFRIRLGPSSVSCALKEHTRTWRAHYRVSNALLVPTILVQVRRHQSPAKFALKEPTTPRLEWETALHVSCVLLERTTAMPDPQTQTSVNLAPEVHGAR